MHLHRILRLSLLASAAFCLSPSTSLADERHFAFSYETITAAKGQVELENWITWQARRGGGDNANLWKFRTEIEYGITDRLQLGLYLANWNLTNDATHDNSVRYESASAELIYRMSHPTTDPIGSAIYLEVAGGHNLFAVEGKLLLQKNIGKLIVIWNGVLEAEWAGRGLRERTGVLEQTFGVSYQIMPAFSAGGELVHAVAFADWSKSGPNILFAGPNISWRFKRGYVTAATLFQCTNIKDEPDIQTRMIFGVRF